MPDETSAAVTDVEDNTSLLSLDHLLRIGGRDVRRHPGDLVVRNGDVHRPAYVIPGIDHVTAFQHEVELLTVNDGYDQKKRRQYKQPGWTGAP